MCKIIKGDEATEIMNATLDDLDGLNRIMEDLALELDAIWAPLRSENDE